MGRASGGLPGAQGRVGTGDVEITQDDVIEVVRDAGVAQHDLGHELRGAIWRYRRHRIILADRYLGRIAVHRRRRGKDELLGAAPDGAFNQGAGVRRVVAVVTEGVGNRVRHHDRRSEMNDRGYFVLPNQARRKGFTTGPADDDRHAIKQRHLNPVDKLSTTTTLSPSSTRTWTIWLPI